MARQKNPPLREQSTYVLKNYLFDRFVSIIELEEGKPCSVSSGTLLKVQDKYFIITCGHHVEDIRKKNNDVALLFPSGTANGVMYFEPCIVENFEFLMTNEEGDELDVVWIEVPNNLVDSRRRQFLSPTNLCSSYVYTEEEHDVALVGNPAAWVKPTRKENEYDLTPLFYRGLVIEPPASISINAGVDILISFPSQGFSSYDENPKKDIPPALGLSGSAIWETQLYLNKMEKELWSPKSLRIIGTQKSWYPEFRIIKATLIIHWIKFFCSCFPEFRGEFAF
jgi:hypothetical protein